MPIQAGASCAQLARPTHAAERARRFGAAGATWFSPSAVFAAGLHEVAVDFHAVPVGLGRSAAFYYPYQY